MKFAKFLSVAAASAVMAAVTVSASANLTVVESPDPGLSSGTSSWLVQLYNEGNPDEGKPATNYGIDYAAVAQISVTYTVAEPDYWEGETGGSVIFSCNGGDIVNPSDDYDKYNWPNHEFWGVIDEELELDTQTEAAKAYNTTKVGDYTYNITIPVENPLANGIGKIGCMQVGLQEWSTGMTDLTVTGCEALDASGNVLLSFDGNGKLLSSAAPAATPEPAPAEDNGSAPAATPAATAASDNKGSPDTGVEGIAAAAGVAVLAAGAVVLSKKRK